MLHAVQPDPSTGTDNHCTSVTLRAGGKRTAVKSILHAVESRPEKPGAELWIGSVLVARYVYVRGDLAALGWCLEPQFQGDVRRVESRLFELAPTLTWSRTPARNGHPTR